MDSKIADSVVRIPTKLDIDFFKYWFRFLSPFHGLSPKQIDVISELVYERYKLSKIIHDEEILNQVLMNAETMERVINRCNIGKSYFTVVLRRLKKLGIILGDRINPRFIPQVKEDQDSFKLMLLFDFEKDVEQAVQKDS